MPQGSEVTCQTFTSAGLEVCDSACQTSRFATGAGMSFCTKIRLVESLTSRVASCSERRTSSLSGVSGGVGLTRDAFMGGSSYRQGGRGRRAVRRGVR